MVSRRSSSIILFYSLLSKLNEVAIYEDKIYTPNLSEEHMKGFEEARYI